MTFDLDIWQGRSFGLNLGQMRRSRLRIKKIKVTGGRMVLFRLKVNERNWENQIRQRGPKTDLNWKLQISSIAAKWSGATSSEGYI